MPTPNPRISITLQPSLAAVLRELSALSGNSQSSIVAELLETSQPVFEKMVLVMRAAATVREASKQDLVAGLERAQGRLEQQLGLISDEFDAVARPVLDAAERIDRRAGRGGAERSEAGARPARAGSKTPLSNRGVRYPGNRQKTRTESRG
ncbi:MAG: ribbon-helix-helix protein, CopG family [Betaproteobacteria bacterium]|nr:ribbon-helix-helix protein, CopG family [Betaproteobacteria bacterium]